MNKKYIRDLIREFLILWKGITPFYMKIIFPFYATFVFFIAKTLKKNNSNEYIRNKIWKRFIYKIKLDGFLFVSERSLASIHLMPNYEEETLKRLKKINGNVFIDVGAHIGRYSIVLSKNFRKIIAIEPDPYNFSYLVRHVYLNNLQEKVHPLNCALLDKIDIIKFYIDEKGIGSHSIIKENKSKFVINVIALPLDYIVEKMEIFPKDISLIKIDVEGAEYFVLKGMSKILKEGSPILVVEIWDDNPFKQKTLELLNALGYTVKEIIREGIGTTNYIFIKRK